MVPMFPTGTNGVVGPTRHTGSTGPFETTGTNGDPCLCYSNGDIYATSTFVCSAGMNGRPRTNGE